MACAGSMESEVSVIRGSCLCGAVRYEINGKVSDIGQCHCSKCRKVSGTAGNAVLWTAADSLSWKEGKDLIQSYQQESGYASTFCGRCGSPMPGVAPNGKISFVPAGTLDDDPGSRGMAAHLYVDSKAPWDVISDSATQYSEGFDSEELKPASR